MSQSLGKVTAQTTRAIKADAIYTVGGVTGGHVVSRRRRCGCGCGCGLHHDALAKLHLQEFAVLGELAQIALPDVLHRWHVALVVGADEDKRRQIPRVHVRVRETACQSNTCIMHDEMEGGETKVGRRYREGI